MSRCTLVVGLLPSCLDLIALLSAASSFAAQPAPWAGAAGQTQVETRTLESSSGAKIRADVGVLAVPERRAAKNSRLIEIRFARLHSTAAHPGVPLFYLTGGPG